MGIYHVLQLTSVGIATGSKKNQEKPRWPVGWNYLQDIDQIPVNSDFFACTWSSWFFKQMHAHVFQRAHCSSSSEEIVFIWKHIALIQKPAQAFIVVIRLFLKTLIYSVTLKKYQNF